MFDHRGDDDHDDEESPKNRKEVEKIEKNLVSARYNNNTTT